MAILIKNKDQILNDALRKLQKKTSITSISPGSVARSLTEAIAQEMGDLYGIMDFNLSLADISTAQGRTLDMIGVLYNTRRKTLNDIAVIDKSSGAFYFYLEAPYTSTITVPIGTRIYTSLDNAVGQQFTYATTDTVTLPAGRTRVYATIRPEFGDAVFTAGANTLTVIDPSFTQPSGTTLKATNPKAIDAQLSYEDDASYRSRIIASVRTAAGGTTSAVRLAALNVSGVRDITIRDAPYGLGSFEALVVAEDNLLNGPILRAASQVMEDVRPVGVRMYVRQPDLVPMDVHASIVIRNDVIVDRTNIARRVEIGILRYLNTMLVGTPLVYNQLIQAILDATDVVADVTITRLTANGTEILRKNYTPESDQQIIPGEIKVSPAS